MSVKAILEAIEAKRAIERKLEADLEEFSAITGLRVSGGTITPIETTHMGSKHPEWGNYSVQLEVDIP